MATREELRLQIEEADDLEDMPLVAQLRDELKVLDITDNIAGLEKKRNAAPRGSQERKDLNDEIASQREERGDLRKKIDRPESYQPPRDVPTWAAGTRYEPPPTVGERLEDAGYKRPDFPEVPEVDYHYEELKREYLAFINKDVDPQQRGGQPLLRKELNPDEEKMLRQQAANLKDTGDVTRVTTPVDPLTGEPEVSPVGAGLLTTNPDVEAFFAQLGKEKTLGLSETASSKEAQASGNQAAAASTTAPVSNQGSVMLGPFQEGVPDGDEQLDIWYRAADFDLNKKSMNYQLETDPGKKAEMREAWKAVVLSTWERVYGDPSAHEDGEIEKFLYGRYIRNSPEARADNRVNPDSWFNPQSPDKKDFVLTISDDTKKAMEASPGWRKAINTSVKLSEQFIYTQLLMDYQQKNPGVEVTDEIKTLLSSEADAIFNDVMDYGFENNILVAEDPEWETNLNNPSLYTESTRRVIEFKEKGPEYLEERMEILRKGDAGPKRDWVKKRLIDALQESHPDIDLSTAQADKFLTATATTIVDQAERVGALTPGWDEAFITVDNMIDDIIIKDTDAIVSTMDIRTNEDIVENWIELQGFDDTIESTLLSNISEFIEAWKLDPEVIETNQSLENFMTEKGTVQAPLINQAAIDRISGTENATTAWGMYRREAIKRGLLPKDPTGAQIKSVNDGFHAFYTEYTDAKVRDPLTNFKAMMGENLNALPDATEVTRRDKSRMGSLPPGFDPNKAMYDSITRLEDRVGTPTAADDIAKVRADLQAVTLITSDELAWQEADPDYWAESNNKKIDLEEKLATMEGQETQRLNDVKLAKLFRDIPSLATAYATGDSDLLEKAMKDWEIDDDMKDHINTSQQREGLVLTPQELALRSALNIPTPSYDYQTRDEIAEQTRQTELGKAQMASRTKRYTAEGEEIKFDPDRATYDVGAMSRSGPLTALGTSFIPGTKLLDTMENRAALKQGIGGPGPRQGEGFELDAQGNPVPVVAPPMPEGYQPPPQMLGYYPEEEEEEDLGAKGPHETGPLPTPTTPNQPSAPARRRGGATGF